MRNLWKWSEASRKRPEPSWSSSKSVFHFFISVAWMVSLVSGMIIFMMNSPELLSEKVKGLIDSSEAGRLDSFIRSFGELKVTFTQKVTLDHWKIVRATNVLLDSAERRGENLVLSQLFINLCSPCSPSQAIEISSRCTSKWSPVGSWPCLSSRY